MRIRVVDERKSSQEDYHPVFWAYLWSRPPIPEGVDPDRIAWSNDSYELTECDVHQAIEWVRDNTPKDGFYTLYLAYVEPDKKITLIQLAGVDPTST